MATCPICGDNDNKQSLCKTSLTYQTEFDLLECTACKVKYFYPVPTNEQLSLFYSDHAYEFDRWRQQVKADDYLKQLLRHKSTGKLLDIGCATGYFIHRIAEQSDWDVYGVELGELPAKFASEQLGLNVIHGDLYTANYDAGFFDAIYIGDVLEHVPDPVQIMNECRRILKPDGVIYLDIPNGAVDSDGLIKFYHEENKPGRHASGHIYFFESESLQKLFELTGFKIKRSRSFAIRKGLRAMGILPQKKNWKNFFQPSTKPEVACESKVEVQEDKPHSDFYYQYRYYKKHAFSLPGLRRAGLNFRLQLVQSVNK